MAVNARRSYAVIVNASSQVLEWKAPEVGREQFVAEAKELTMVDAAGRYSGTVC